MQLDPWPSSLVRAVDEDNLRPDRSCNASLTLAALRRAPEPFKQQATIATCDFLRSGEQPLTSLRSDAVAEQFLVKVPGPNVVVGRMTVPGGPWPGRYGLEAVAFDAEQAYLLPWFPTVTRELSLHFGSWFAASRAYTKASGSVLFPEQLSVLTRSSQQSFGVVFLDRLASLFTAKVLPLTSLTFVDQSDSDLYDLRRTAFLAHEWGHLVGVDLERSVLARRRRLVAIISELHADMAALNMLLGAGSDQAIQAAHVLVFDRILREAWLTRAQAQVDSIAGRQLLNLLAEANAIQITDEGQVDLQLDSAEPRIEEEVALLTSVEKQCSYDGLDPGLAYMRSYGWTIKHDNYFPPAQSAIARAIDQRVLASNGARR